MGAAEWATRAHLGAPLYALGAGAAAGLLYLSKHDDPPEREPSDSDSHSAPKSATHATKREGKSGSAVAQREEGSLIRRVRRRLWLGTPARCGCGRMRRRVCCGGCRLLPCTFRAGSGAGAGDVVDVLRVAYLLQSRRVQNVKIEKDDEPGRQVFLV